MKLATLRALLFFSLCLVAPSLFASALEECISKLDELSADGEQRKPYVDVVVQSSASLWAKGYAELPTDHLFPKKITRPLKRLIHASINHTENVAYPGVAFDFHKDAEEFTRSKNGLNQFLHSLDTFVSAVLIDSGAEAMVSQKHHREFTVRNERNDLWGPRKQRQKNLRFMHTHNFPPTDFEYTLSTNWRGTVFRKDNGLYSAAPGNLTLFRPITPHAAPAKPFFFGRVFIYGRLKR